MRKIYGGLAILGIVWILLAIFSPDAVEAVVGFFQTVFAGLGHALQAIARQIANK